MRGVLGLLASVLVVGAAIVVSRPGHDVGYVEIKTVPIAPVTHTVLYIDSTKLAPIKDGRAILRKPVGTLKLETDGHGGSFAPLCDVVVMKNRITTVTISVVELPPRCQCRFSGTDSTTRADHTCVS
jgi:hypothetical protein